MEQEGKKPARLVVSYSHRDEIFRDEVTRALAPAIRAGELEIWSDHRIVPGRNIDDEIMAQLREADGVLLLVSADFIASDYCFKTELEIALDRHRNGRAIVLPIVIRPTDFSEMPFSNLKMLPADAKAVTTWDNRDEALLSVVRGVRAAIKDLPKITSEHSIFSSKNIQQCLVESFDVLQNKYENQDTIERNSTGFRQFDDLLLFLSPGDVVVVAGRPGSGFLELTTSLIEFAAIKHRRSIRIFSQRLSAPKYANKMLCSTGFVSLTDLQLGQLEDEDWSRVHASIRLLRNTDISIDDEAIRSLSDLERKLASLNIENSGLLLIDGLEYLSSGSRQDEKAIIYKIRDFARSRECCVLMTFSLGHQVDERATREPVMSDLAGWEGLEFSSERIMLVSRPDFYLLNGRDYGQLSLFKIEIAKNNDGVLGDAELRLHTYSGAVTEARDEEVKATDE